MSFGDAYISFSKIANIINITPSEDIEVINFTSDTSLLSKMSYEQTNNYSIDKITINSQHLSRLKKSIHIALKESKGSLIIQNIKNKSFQILTEKKRFFETQSSNFFTYKKITKK